MKLNLNSIFESMNARRRNIRANSDKPPEDKVTKSILEYTLNTRICQKYNDGKIYHFSDFNDSRLYTYAEIAEYVSNLSNVINNYLKQKLIQKDIYHESEIIRKEIYADQSMLASDGNVSLHKTKYIFDKNELFRRSVSSDEFIDSLTFDCIPIVKETFNVTVNFMTLYDFLNISSPIRPYRIFTLAHLNDHKVDAFTIIEILKNLNGVIEYLKDCLNPGFKKFYQLLVNISNIGFCFKMNSENLPVMAYIIIHRNKDAVSIVRTIANENNSSADLEQLSEVVKDDFFNSFSKCISAIFQGVCCKNEKAAEWFQDGETYLPAAEFIDDIFTENHMICPDGHVPVTMEDVLKVTDTNSEVNADFKCTESVAKLFSSDAVLDEYEGLDNFKDYN